MKQQYALRSALVVALPFCFACAADLPADERRAIVEDSILDAGADTVELARARIAGCLEAYEAQFEPIPLQQTGAKGDTIPAELAAAVAERDYDVGEDPAFARAQGWPVDMPEQVPGSILPCHRIVAYYGNPLSSRMGVLGEYAKDEMLRRFGAAVAEWNAPIRSTRSCPRSR